jgi:hypothetical protein
MRLHKFDQMAAVCVVPAYRCRLGAPPGANLAAFFYSMMNEC